MGCIIGPFLVTIEPRRSSRIFTKYLFFMAFLAERVRFELTKPLRVCRFSRPVHSTALPPLLTYISVGYNNKLRLILRTKSPPHL